MSKKTSKSPKATKSESKPKTKKAKAAPEAGAEAPPAAEPASTAEVATEATPEATPEAEAVTSNLQIKKDANGRFWVVPKDGSQEHGPYDTKKEATDAKHGLASGGAAPAAATETKPAKAKKEPKPKRVSALDAAAQVLAAGKEPMNCMAMIEAMATQGLWSSPGGATPHATLYSAIIREIATKGAESRFVKKDRGMFAAASAQTYNHYLRTAKQFTRWLVRDRRIPSDPLVHLSNINTSVDRRHDRRALTYEEFARLSDAARTGKAIEGMSGPDRAMLYVLAGWTGFRKGELGSLTRTSFRLEGEPATVTVAAGYSKRRRTDTQILHPEVVEQLKAWLAGKKLAPDQLLFVISERAGGLERDTSNMIRKDLARARELWLKEAATADEQKQRGESDFLRYETRDGLFADFHSLRHFFITSLERSGISPKMAQTLARHSDIRLTLGIYTHVGLRDQTLAIEALPSPTATVRAAM